MKKEFHAVLSFDCNNEALMQTLQSIVVEHLRKMFASALLAHGAINDGSVKPEIHLYSDDFLMGKEDIGVPPASSPSELSPERAKEQIEREVAEHGGPKSVGGPSFGDEEEG